MRCIPCTRMTGRTVGGCRIADGGSDQGAAAGIMTARAGIMCFRCCTYQRIIVTVSTACCANRDAGMAGIGRMRRLPGTCMTGGAVGRGRVADGRSYQGTGSRIMTARAGVMVRSIARINKRCVTMAVRTACCANRDTGMAGIRCMHPLPRTRMTDRTVTAANST